MTPIKRRLVGKDGAERVRELRGILSELPNYKNGPYADIRKWVLGELDATPGERPEIDPLTNNEPVRTLERDDLANSHITV